MAKPASSLSLYASHCVVSQFEGLAANVIESSGENIFCGSTDGSVSRIRVKGRKRLGDNELEYSASVEQALNLGMSY